MHSEKIDVSINLKECRMFVFAVFSKEGLMKISRLLLFALTALLFVSQNVCSAEPQVQLFMADGQLKSHPMRLFITKDIDESMMPQLLLTGSHAISKKQIAEGQRIEPMLIARHQQSEQVVNDAKVSLSGTLILFDLSHYPIPFYKAVMRLTPTLIWQEAADDGSQQVAIGDREIYLANPVPAFLWPLTVVVLLVVMITTLAKLSHQSAIRFICDSEGYLSLSRTQVALWTVAIGCMVTAYGFMRLEVPEIPASLVVLMGLSLATGGISYTQSDMEKEEAAQPSGGAIVAAQPLHATSVADLVLDYKYDPQGRLSLARAQMLFWTVLTLLLFIVKSILDGDLWPVPWELVALMGLSQAGYLAPKITIKN